MNEGDPAQQLLICDIRPDFKGNPFITFWRAKNSGYSYPLSWAGDYTPEIVENSWLYYHTVEAGSLIRFAVLRSVAEQLAIPTQPRTIDGDAGPVIVNKLTFRCKLLEAAYISRTPR